eukprot:TRINITY_DN61010_c0_g1_i1.p1 TRINITY_DN61010_c0_g1~~TRINITY_DN61010_c0_g1_i1.p1  ORF type:complete len:590 (+),score=93.41 TRINITY_DN61010_c0_g1_i1:98-1867(+)
MRSSFAKAVEAVLRPFGIRRASRGARRDTGTAGDHENNQLQDDAGGWEVDPIQFVGATTGALLGWWAIRCWTSGGRNTPALTVDRTPGGDGAGSKAMSVATAIQKLPLSEFLKLLRTGTVTAVTYLADRRPAGALLVQTTATSAERSSLGASTSFAATPCVAISETLLLPGCHASLFEELRACKGLHFECCEVPADDSDMSLSLLFDAGGLLVSIAALVYMLRGSGQGGFFTGRNLEDQAKEDTQQTGVTFADVAGMEETKNELREVISFLRNPQSFYALGARPPRGILLTGPSGTGKTLLARAVAGEAKVPFLYASSAAFVEIYVGQGAQRLRKFFENARSCAPCIAFLDEIDAVGASRHEASAGGNQEYAQTVNQLLLELDGIESYGEAGTSSHRTVVTMAATNRYDFLDDALVRPGRLDRIVLVSLPTFTERVATLQIHARRLRTEDSLNFEEIARRTEGSSGADLANLLNEAALLAARQGSDAVTAKHIDGVLQKPRLKQRSQEQSQYAGGMGGEHPQRGASSNMFDLGGRGDHGMANGNAQAELWTRMFSAVAAEIAAASSINRNGGGGSNNGFSPTVTVADCD